MNAREIGAIRSMFLEMAGRAFDKLMAEPEGPARESVPKKVLGRIALVVAEEPEDRMFEMSFAFTGEGAVLRRGYSEDADAAVRRAHLVPGDALAPESEGTAAAMSIRLQKERERERLWQAVADECPDHRDRAAHERDGWTHFYPHAHLAVPHPFECRPRREVFPPTGLHGHARVTEAQAAALQFEAERDPAWTVECGAFLAATPDPNPTVEVPRASLGLPAREQFFGGIRRGKMAATREAAQRAADAGERVAVVQINPASGKPEPVPVAAAGLPRELRFGPRATDWHPTCATRCVACNEVLYRNTATGATWCPGCGAKRPGDNDPEDPNGPTVLPPKEK